MVEVMKIELIDFGIDFIRYKFIQENFTYFNYIRKYMDKYYELESRNEFNELKYKMNFEINGLSDYFITNTTTYQYKNLRNILDNYLFFSINIQDRGFKEYSINENIKLNDLIYKIQDIEYIKENHENKEIKFIGIKYFLYNREQNRTITLYDHQIKFIQEHFNKT